MKTHIEYDDFGEYIETLEDFETEYTYPAAQQTCKDRFGRKSARAHYLRFIDLHQERNCG